jgi:hypothetical protein
VRSGEPAEVDLQAQPKEADTKEEDDGESGTGRL